MMTLLALAAKANGRVAIYRDHNVAHLGKNARGQMAVPRIDLNPVMRFVAAYRSRRKTGGDAAARPSLLLPRQQARR